MNDKEKRQAFADSSEPGDRFIWDEGDIEIIEPGQDDEDEESEKVAKAATVAIAMQKAGATDEAVIDYLRKELGETWKDVPRDDKGHWMAAPPRAPSWNDTEARYHRDQYAEKEPEKPKPSQEVIDLAAVIEREARAEAPARDREMELVAKATNGTLLGLQHNVKTTPSMARKLWGDMNEKGLTKEQAAAAVGDSIRYTVAYEPNEYAEGVRKALEQMREIGYRPVEGKFKNTWAKPEDGTPGNPFPTYQGINAVMYAPSGRRVEVQFHTEQSFKVKEEINHKYYEAERVSGKGEKIWLRARQVMRRNSAHIERPGESVHLITWEEK